MGGCDKGLVPLGEQAMVQWTLATVRPFSARLIISCNRNQSQYAALADTVVSDIAADFPGPLAGIQSALAATTGTHLLVLPCDTPWVSSALIAKLVETARSSPESIAISELNGRMEPLHAIIPVSLAASLETFLQSGQRAVRFWYQQHPMTFVAVDDQAELANINDPQELAQAEKHLRQKDSQE